MATPTSGDPATGWWPTEGRATHAVVDLDAIAANVVAARTHAGGRALIAVVKANAYGHGVVMVAEAALAAGAAMLAVATVDEALELRDAGIGEEILVMGPADPAEYRDAFAAGVTLALGDAYQVEPMGAAARSAGRPGAVHVKVETGMNRYGLPVGDAASVAGRVAVTDGLSLAGTFTHLADADGEDLAFSEAQADRLAAAVAGMREAGIDPGTVHLANTAGTMRLVPDGVDAVRLGIGLYGLRPDPSVSLLPGMRLALSLRTRVAQVRRLNAGDTVSYGRTYRAEAPEHVALLPVGYADGFRRGVSAGGWVGIGGDRQPIRGRVCMDQVVVGCEPATRPGDRVALLGDGAAGEMTHDDAAALAGTIAYEIATGIATRVPRWYLRAGQPVARLRGGTLTRLV